jgi:hypothetical protein
MIRLEKDEVNKIEIDGSIFHYRVLNAEDEAKVQNEMVKVNPKGKIDWKMGEYLLRSLERGLVDWENVAGDDGKVINFSKDLIKFLPRSTREKLRELIIPGGLTTEEEKN